MKVYLVEVGNEEYRYVAAVYMEDQKIEAKKTARLIGGDVKEMEVDSVKLVDPGLDFFKVEMRRNGESTHWVDIRLMDGEYDEEEFGKQQQPECFFRTRKDNEYERKSHWLIVWSGYAKSEEYAIRSVNEIRRLILAGQRPDGVDMGKN